jgi:uncharacterized damage-inducible protein DinB
VRTPNDGREVIDAIQAILSRDLRGLERELNAYPDESTIWATSGSIDNSAGTLALHIAGNIQHFVGAVLGGSGYVRDRVAEFNSRDVPKTELERELAAALQTVESVFPTLTPEQLAAPFPVEIGGRRVRTADFLAHLAAHLAYHLGQVDYHRRIIAGGAPIDSVSPSELRTP